MKKIKQVFRTRTAGLLQKNIRHLKNSALRRYRSRNEENKMDAYREYLEC